MSAKNTLAATQWMCRPGKGFVQALGDPKCQPTKEQRNCPHLEWTPHANGYGAWKKCSKCGLRLEYRDKKSGAVARYGNFTGICTVLNSSGAPNVLDDEGYVIMVLDSGSKRSVAGPAWHDAMAEACRQASLRLVYKRVDEKFLFGDGDEVRATRSVEYLVGIYGLHGCLDVAMVDRPCPGLMSRRAMSELGCVIDFSKDTMQFRAHGNLRNVPIMNSGTGHPVVRTADYGDDVQKSFPVKFRSRQLARATKRESEATMISQQNDETLPEMIETEDEAVSVEQMAETGCCATVRRIARGARKRLARVTSQLSEAFRTESHASKPTRT